MRARSVAWWVLWPAWVPAVAVLAVALGGYVWLNGTNVGRQAQVQKTVTQLRARVAHLEALDKDASSNRAAMVTLDHDLHSVYGSVFDSLSDRLPGILKAIGAATQEAGLFPQRYSYSAKRDTKLDLVAFGIRFSVSGTYIQIRKLLAALQASPEFFIIDQIRLGGEGGTMTTQLKVSIHVSTYLAKADERLLKRLTGGFGAAASPAGRQRSVRP